MVNHTVGLGEDEPAHDPVFGRLRGWLGFAATAPEHRRKGGQGAILSARIDRARELGVETPVTETGVVREGRPSNSYRNVLRSGFMEAYVRENHLSPEPWQT